MNCTTILSSGWLENNRYMKKKNLPLIEHVEITGVAAEGKALVRINDIVTFVPNCVPGDIVDLQITKKKAWEKIRRPQILQLFRDNEYGVMPDAEIVAAYRVVEESDNALAGKAIRRQVEITFSGNGQSRTGQYLLCSRRRGIHSGGGSPAGIGGHTKRRLTKQAS